MISQISAIALLAASASAAPFSASSQYTSPQSTANQSAPPQPAPPQPASPWSAPPPSTAPWSALSWFAPPWVTSHPPWQGGCGKEHSSGYIDTPLTILSGGHVRTFTIQHGRGGTSATQRDNSQYYNYAQSSDYIIVYPQGLSSQNSTAFQGPSYALPGVNDVQFVADLLTHLEIDFCLDTDRLYASGKSNGAGFVDTLACSEVGDRFAAFAMASAALYTDNAPGSCTKKRAMLEAHGDADPTVPYLGGQGRGGWTPNVSDWVDWWGVRTCGAGKARKSTERKPGYELETYSCDEGGLDDVITHYHLDAPAAHCWPDAQGDNYDSLRTPEGCGNSRSLDFTAVVFEWFERWDLKNAPGAASYGWSGGAFGGGKDRYDL